MAHALFWEIAVPVLVAGILGLFALVRNSLGRLHREQAVMRVRLTRALALVEGEPPDPLTGDAGRSPIAQQVAVLRTVQDQQGTELAAQTVSIGVLRHDVDAVLTEVRPNHGSSMRDRVDQALDGIRRIETRLTGGTP